MESENTTEFDGSLLASRLATNLGVFAEKMKAEDTTEFDGPLLASAGLDLGSPDMMDHPIWEQLDAWNKLQHQMLMECFASKNAASNETIFTRGVMIWLGILFLFEIVKGFLRQGFKLIIE